jgi:hypothetical protein
MSYYFKRYLSTLRTYRRWTLLALVPPVLYLVFAAVTDVTYRVEQDFDGYSPETLIAASNSPIATLKLGRVVADPALLFLDTTALAQLLNRLRASGGYTRILDERRLHQQINEAMSLTQNGETRLWLRYRGSDESLGRLLVAYYGDRLLKRINNGEAHARGPVGVAGPQLQPAGPLLVSAERTPWPPSRLPTAALVLLLSTLAVLALIAWFDISDPAFRSERQIARYLGVPMLGVLPDASPLLVSLPR